MGTVQRTNVIHRADFLLLPAFKNLVGVLETCLTGLEDGAVTCLLNDLHGKTIGLEPGVHQCDLCFDRITVGDAQCFQDRKIILIISGTGLLRFFDGGDALLGPCKGNLFDVADALVIVADAVLDQIVDQVYGHAEAIIEK